MSIVKKIMDKKNRKPKPKDPREFAIIKRKGKKVTITIPIPDKPTKFKDEEIRIVRY